MEMNKEAEKRVAAKLAKTMAIICVRNTHLEMIHTGKTLVTRTGEWSDVTVVDANDNRTQGKTSRASATMKMRELLREIVSRLYTFHLYGGEPEPQAKIDRWIKLAGKWSKPRIDTRKLKQKGGMV
jgi:hypothetical protein